MTINITLLTTVLLCFAVGFLPLVMKNEDIQFGKLIILPFLIALAVHFKDTYAYVGTENYFVLAPKYFLPLGVKGFVAMSVAWLICKNVNNERDDG